MQQDQKNTLNGQKQRGRGREFFRRYGPPIGAGVLSACLIAAIIFGYRMKISYDRAQKQLQNAYINCFNIVGDHLLAINTDLIKMRVCTSPAQQTVLLYTIWRETGQAQFGLSQLPVDEQSSNSMLQFVNRLGDYCFTLAKSIDLGSGITDDQYEKLRSLEMQSAQVAAHVETLRDAGGVSWAVAQAAWSDGGQSPKLDGIGQVSDSIQEYPALIYDGPYSERSENIEPKAAAGEEVSYEKAVETAQRFMQGTYTRNDDQGAQVPTYCMTCTGANGVQNEIQVTKKAGMIYSILPNGATATDVFPTNEQVPDLIGIAKDYLEQRGFPAMQSAYAQFYAGAAVINMVPVQDGVLLYPDLVKVWVDISTKQIIGLDAHNYTVSHIKRDFPTKLLGKQKLSERVAKRLDIQNVRLALIPYNATQERLCYEFTGKNGADTFALFLSAVDGDELDIKLILDADDGTFTY